MKNITTFFIHVIKVLHFGTGLGGTNLGRAATLDLRFSASIESFFDCLDIFSDATDRKITLSALILRHTDSLGAGTSHTESVTEIAIGAVLLPRSLIAVRCCRRLTSKSTAKRAAAPGTVGAAQVGGAVCRAAG